MLGSKLGFLVGILKCLARFQLILENRADSITAYVCSADVINRFALIRRANARRL